MNSPGLPPRRLTTKEDIEESTRPPETGSISSTSSSFSRSRYILPLSPLLTPPLISLTLLPDSIVRHPSSPLLPSSRPLRPKPDASLSFLLTSPRPRDVGVHILRQPASQLLLDVPRIIPFRDRRSGDPLEEASDWETECEGSSGEWVSSSNDSLFLFPAGPHS